MRRHLFRLCVSAAAFVLGLTSAGLWPRESVPRPLPPVVAAPTATAKSGCAPGESETVDDDTRVEDRYYNYNYGFSVDLPAGMVGFASAPPRPAHGFGINLVNPKVGWVYSEGFPKSYLYVDASYNSAFLESLDAAVKTDLRYIAEEGQAVTVLSRTKTRLGGLRAVRVVARYVKDGEATVSDALIAFRKDNGEDVVYTIALDTPQADYEKHRLVVNEMQKTFCLQPLP
ncbi:MAG: hypothetical protein QOC61_2325 [Acidobacteriota bacterium]|nr:hypothetical protein [Acidobacteriota bacterium]